MAQDRASDEHGDGPWAFMKWAKGVGWGILHQLSVKFSESDCGRQEFSDMFVEISTRPDG